MNGDSVLQLGSYRMERCDSQYGRDLGFDCPACKRKGLTGKPICLVTELVIKVSVECPRCGSDFTLAAGPTQEIACVLPSVPANTSADF